MERLLGNLTKLEQRIVNSLADDDIVTLMYKHSKLLTDDNGISTLIKSYSDKNIPCSIQNNTLFDIAFNIGILTGILKATDNIYFLITDFSDDYTFEDVQELQDSLEQVTKILPNFTTKIRPKKSKYNAVNTLLNEINVLISQNNFMLFNNPNLDYCIISGCISCIALSIKNFVKYYLELDFAEVNSIPITNMFYLMGIITGIMKTNNIKNKSIFNSLDFIKKILKSF